MPEMSGAGALVESLANEGVEVLFGIPGVQVMGFLDALYQQPKVRWVSVRHEQTAAFMAFGYARTTGRVGVAMVVPGPGALNASAAVGTAYAASTPVFVISGQIATFNQGKNHGALHEVDDQLDVFRPITKWCHRVGKAEQIPGAVREAMRYLKTGRPQPVELEIPWDLWAASGAVEFPPKEMFASAQPDPLQVKEVAAMLAAAKHPVIWAGGGIITSDAGEEMTRLAERLTAPVVTTDEGKGAINENHPLALGNNNMGMNPVLPLADVILVVGSRFSLSFRSPWKVRPDQNIIQVEIDAAEMGRNQPVSLGIVAAAKATLAALLKEIPAGGDSQWSATELAKIKTGIRARLEAAAPLQFSMIQTIREELPEEGILIPGVTNLGYWCHLAYPVLRPRTYLTSSYFYTLGYAYATALGAKAGNPQKPVVALCGDGGFLYSLQDLATAVQEGLNVVAVVLVDGSFGACLRIQQRLYKDRIIGTKLNNPDFARLAETFGAEGIKLSGPDELRDGLRHALASNRPTVVEVPVPNVVLPWETSLVPED